MPPRVAELGVDDRAGRLVEVVGGEPLQRSAARPARRSRISRTSVMSISATRSRDRLVLAADRAEPVRSRSKDGSSTASLPSRRKPVRPLPAEFLSRTRRRSPRASRCSGERRSRRAASRSSSGQCDRVVARRSSRPRARRDSARAVVRLPKRRTSNGHRSMPGIAVDDPVRHRQPGAARRRDARGEAAGDVEIVELRREAHDRLAVGRDRDRAVDHGADADLVQHRDALGGRQRERARAGPCSAGTARGRNPIGSCRRAERRRARLPAADRERAGLGLEIEDSGRDRAASAGRSGMSGDLLGHHVLVLDAPAGSSMPAISPTSRAHMPAALTTISQSMSPWSVTHARDAAGPCLEARDQHALDDPHAARARALGVGHGQANTDRRSRREAIQAAPTTSFRSISGKLVLRLVRADQLERRSRSSSPSVAARFSSSQRASLLASRRLPTCASRRPGRFPRSMRRAELALYCISRVRLPLRAQLPDAGRPRARSSRAVSALFSSSTTSRSPSLARW